MKFKTKLNLIYSIKAICFILIVTSIPYLLEVNWGFLNLGYVAIGLVIPSYINELLELRECDIIFRKLVNLFSEAEERLKK